MGPHQTDPTDTSISDSQPAELCGINSCCLSPAVYGIWLQQPELAEMLAELGLHAAHWLLVLPCPATAV